MQTILKNVKVITKYELLDTKRKHRIYAILQYYSSIYISVNLFINSSLLNNTDLSQNVSSVLLFHHKYKRSLEGGDFVQYWFEYK